VAHASARDPGGALQSDGAHAIGVEMMQYFENHRRAVAQHPQCAPRREQSLAGHVHHRAVNADDAAKGGGGIHTQKLTTVAPSSA
jgi:hypothetical protein